MEENSFFTKNILFWYKQNKRDLPWRNTKNAYFIWLSEIILQQTKVAQGLPYYLKFIDSFPNIHSLAEAKEEEVLRLWQGLGYYSRARNLHTTAKIIVENYGGIFPKTYQELLQLKGIGTYTAAAIASFAFKEKIAVIDGNVFRVLARYFGEKTDISSHKAKKIFTDLATNLLPSQEVDTYNQAIMEFGALHCIPNNPRCNSCILALHCEAKQNQEQDILPIKAKKIKVKKRFFHYFFLEKDGLFFMQKRKEKDIWQEMYEFYLVEKKDIEPLVTIIENDIFLQTIAEDAILCSESEVFIHILSHQKIIAKFWHFQLQKSIDFNTENWYSLAGIEKLPKSTLITRYLALQAK